MRLVPHLVQLHEEKKDKGLNIIALTNNDRGTLEKFVAEKGITYPIAIGGGGAYGVSGIPHAYLIGADGKVVWEGNPSGANLDAMIDAELEKVRFFPEADYSKRFNGALSACQKKDWTKALKEADKIAADEKRSTEEDIANATALRAYIEGLAADLLEEAKGAAETNDYFAAARAFGALEKQFEGLEASEEAEKTLKAWKKDKAIKKALKAGQLLEQGRALEKAKNFKGAMGAYMKAVKEGKDTIYEQPAKDAAQALSAKGVR